MQALLNRIITKIEINDEATQIAFTNSLGNKTSFAAVGDCCSTSWLSGISGIDNLFGAIINEIDVKEIFTEVKEPWSDVIEVFGYTLKTSKGYCDITFRNESNGYYSGWLDLIEDTDDDLHEVREDFGS